MHMHNRSFLGALPLAVLFVSGACIVACGRDAVGENTPCRDSEHPSRIAASDCEEEALDKGDDFTGATAACLLAAANLPALLGLLVRGLIRYAPFGLGAKERLKGFGRNQKKCLMPLHYWANILGALLAFFHLGLSHCGSSSLPEWGMAVMTVLVVTGILMKLKRALGRMRKVAHQIHTNPLTSGLFLAVLLIGHCLVD
ncbi:MAG: hypothetical protein WCK89_15495 [bacterium]